MPDIHSSVANSSMSHGIHVLSSRLMAQQDQLTTIAENVANVNTNGFKRLTYEYEAQKGVKGAQHIADYTKGVGVMVDYSQGSLENTSNPFDMALVGDGFFMVQTGEGVKYTRDGHFTLSSNGTLVTNKGEAVLDNAGGLIQIPAGAENVTVTPEGGIATDAGVLANVGVVRFSAEDAKLLHRAGNGFYALDGATPIAVGENARVESGKLETANVNPIEEVTRMQELSNAYQSALKRVKSLEDLEERVIRNLAVMPR